MNRDGFLGKVRSQWKLPESCGVQWFKRNLPSTDANHSEHSFAAELHRRINSSGLSPVPTKRYALRLHI
jgi:hypothetical protein